MKNVDGLVLFGLESDVSFSLTEKTNTLEEKLIERILNESSDCFI